MVSLRGLFFVLCCCVVWGCASGESVDGGVDLLLDRGAGYEARAVAMDRVVGEDWGLAEKMLYRIILEGGHDNRLRFKAIDFLVGRDVERFEAVMGDGLARVGNVGVLEGLVDLAVEKGWRSWGGSLVRSYAGEMLGVDDLDRVERRGLLGLFEGEGIEDIVWGVVKGEGSVLERVAGWEVLCRLGGREVAEGYLKGVGADDGQLLIDLRGGMDDLGVVAMNREEVLWLMYLRMAGQREYYERLRGLVKILDDGQRGGLELRHLGELYLRGEDVCKDTFKEVAMRMAFLMKGRRHVLGGRFVEVLGDKHRQLFKNSHEDLVWGDFMSLSRLLWFMEDKAVVADLFAQAEADLRDKKGEHGGILRVVDGVAMAAGYQGKAGRDDRYVSSGGLIRALYLGGFHYHFHAQRYDNGRYAGPGDYDMRFARRIGGGCVLFTFVEEGVLNVDFYTGGGVVIDMGCLVR